MTRFISLLFCVSLTGCINEAATEPSPPSARSHDDPRGDHDHADGDHPGIGPEGGTLHPIGHTHGSNGATWYYAEVLPVNEDRLSWRVLRKTNSGFKPIETESSDIFAYIHGSDDRPDFASGITFSASDADMSRYSSAIPGELLDRVSWQISIPKILLVSTRMRVSFPAANPRLSEPADSDSPTSESKAEPATPEPNESGRAQ